MKIIFLIETDEEIRKVYKEHFVDRLRDYGEQTFIPVVTKRELIDNKKLYTDVEYIFSTWYMPVLSREEIKEYFPILKAVFYAAGTCKYFAEPYLELGIRVFSARASNGIPVAEFTVAQILLANKGYFQSQSYYKRYQFKKGRRCAENHIGNYLSKVGIIGVGAVGSNVIKLLKKYDLQVYVYDPFLSEERVNDLEVLRVQKVQELFEMCDVISNHLPDNMETWNMLDYSCFSKMKRNASFINTGRGKQVVERDLIKVLKKRTDITAILDVSRHEPTFFTSSFYRLNNVFLSPHIAGSLGQEKWRMADEMLDAYKAIQEGKMVNCEVTSEQLKNMA